MFDGRRPSKQTLYDDIELNTWATKAIKSRIMEPIDDYDGKNNIFTVRMYMYMLYTYMHIPYE